MTTTYRYCRKAFPQRGRKYLGERAIISSDLGRTVFSEPSKEVGRNKPQKQPRRAFSLPKNGTNESSIILQISFWLSIGTIILLWLVFFAS